MEYCEAGRLLDLLNASPASLFSEGVSRRYLHQLVEVLEWLHDRDIAHCDISTNHLLVDENNRLKLTDFSCAQTQVNRQRVLLGVGSTPGFRPPEVLQVVASTPRAVDMWQLGVVLYRMLTGRMPYPALTRRLLADPGSDMPSCREPELTSSDPGLENYTTCSNRPRTLYTLEVMVKKYVSSSSTVMGGEKPAPTPIEHSYAACSKLSDLNCEMEAVSASDLIKRMHSDLDVSVGEAVLLSTAAQQLLKGLLQAVPTERYTLARLKHSDWYRACMRIPHIGNFYRVHRPHRLTPGKLENDLKTKWQV